MAGRLALEQSIINHKKIVRAAIRLKHSIAADNELNDVMPLVAARLTAMAQMGLIPEMTMGEALLLAEGVASDPS